jgi:hypothetical protein
VTAETCVISARTEGRESSRPSERAIWLPQIDKEARMALARVVTFEGVSKDRMDEMKREMSEGDRPEGLPASEVVVLHDADAETSLVIIFFENEDDYRKGDEVLSSMPAADTPGQRTSVTKYDVANRMSV